MGGYPVRSNMNWSKNLYTFMLGAIFVLSGCMGAGTTDGQDADDTEATTVINYYNNTTIADGPVWFTQGGTNEYLALDEAGDPSHWGTNITDCTDQGGIGYGGFASNPHCNLIVGSIHTTAGEVLTVVESSIGMTLITTCQGSEDYSMVVSSAGKGTVGTSAAVGSAMDCTHNIRHAPTPNSVLIWSLAYTITPATVVV
jgi:hypothetical protein